MEGGGGDEVARTLRARAGGWWWWWPGSLLSAPQPPRCLPFPPVPFPALCRLPAPLPPSRSLVCPAAPCPAPPPLTLRPPAHRAALSYSHFYLLFPHSRARRRLAVRMHSPPRSPLAPLFVFERVLWGVSTSKWRGLSL